MTREELIQVNREIRKADDSHKWPIRGRFNVANRAIRRVRKNFSEYFHEWCEEEYRETVRREESEIVNNPKNQ